MLAIASDTTHSCLEQSENEAQKCTFRLFITAYRNCCSCRIDQIGTVGQKAQAGGRSSIDPKRAD